jgi:hypothetical protein
VEGETVVSTPIPILVPITVRALVVDDRIVNSARPIVDDLTKRKLPGDGRWSPAAPDYRLVLNSLSAPGPAPFLGAARTDREPMLTPEAALPARSDRGVHLHWVLPAAMRRSWKPQEVALPPLPDRWLIVRFARTPDASEDPAADAWFLDAARVLDSSDRSGACLIIPTADGAGREVAHVGRATPLAALDPAKLSGGRRTALSAIGNRHTASLTFTAAVAECRNVLSWHDAAPPAGKILSYHVSAGIAAPRTSRPEPFRRLPVNRGTGPAVPTGSDGCSGALTATRRTGDRSFTGWWPTSTTPTVAAIAGRCSVTPALRRHTAAPVRRGCRCASASAIPRRTLWWRWRPPTAR